MTNLRRELALAWSEKAQRLGTQLQQMEQGFALFRPEHIEQTRRGFQAAVAWMNYWGAQA